MKRTEWKELFESVPPGLTRHQLARKFRKGYRLTASWAKIFGYSSANAHQLLWTKQRRRKFSKIPWNRVEWRLNNADIARKYGVSREIVRRRRMEFADGRKT